MKKTEKVQRRAKMQNADKYWDAVKIKNAALAEVRELNDKVNQMREKLLKASEKYARYEAEAQKAFEALTDAERAEVRNTNTWGNA